MAAKRNPAGLLTNSTLNITIERQESVMRWKDTEAAADQKEDEEEDEFSVAHFEQQWRLYLANFERRRLKYTDICCCHMDVLHGLDYMTQDLKQLKELHQLQSIAPDVTTKDLFDGHCDCCMLKRLALEHRHSRNDSLSPTPD